MSKAKPPLLKRLQRFWDFFCGYAACECRFCRVTFSAAEKGHGTSPTPYQSGTAKIDICPDCADKFRDDIDKLWNEAFDAYFRRTIVAAMFKKELNDE